MDIIFQNLISKINMAEKYSHIIHKNVSLKTVGNISCLLHVVAF